MKATGRNLIPGMWVAMVKARIPRRLYRVVTVIAGIAVLHGNGEGIYRFSSPECVYTDAKMTTIELDNGIGRRNGYNPYIDHPLWAVRQPGGMLRFYYRSVLHQSYHEGRVSDGSFFGNVVSLTQYILDYTWSLKNPTRKRWRGVQWPRGVKKPLVRVPSDQMEFIQNVYALSAEELIGFVHIERRPRGLMVDFRHPSRVLDRLYAIGIARSTDGGDTWTYCGDVVLLHWDRIDDTVQGPDGGSPTVFSNIGGIPYLIVSDSTGRAMLQLYYNELPGPHTDAYPSAAAAPLDSVVAYARKGKVAVGHWNKWTAGSWSGDPLYGCGDRVLPREPAGCTYDTHTDATWCSATGQYLLAVTAIDHRTEPDSTVCSLLLFASANGVDWHRTAQLDRSSRSMPVYASIIDASDDAAIDNHTVGGDFTLLYARRPANENGFDYAHPDLYKIAITTFRSGD